MDEVVEHATEVSRHTRWVSGESFRRVSPPRWPFLFRGLLPLLAFIGVTLFGVTRFANGWIEAQAHEYIREALDDAGYGWAELVISGQQARLSGSASPQNGDNALAVASAARCPTWLGSKVCAVSAVGNFSQADVAWPDLRGTVTDGVLTLRGEVVDDATRAAVIDVAQQAVAAGRVTEVVDELTLAAEGAPYGFDVMAGRVVQVASLCEAGEAALTSGTLSVRCRVARSDEGGIRTLVEPPLPAGTLGGIELVIAEDAAACEGQLAGLLQNARIEFASGSANLVASAGGLLDRIAGVASTCPGTLRVEGHTDSTGDPDANQALSAGRAAAVRDALGSRGVPLNQLIAVGFGQDNPIDSNATAAGRARNRRIEFRVTIDAN